MNARVLRLSVFALAVAATARLQAGLCPISWYNGDPDLINGLSSEISTAVFDARVYDDFDVASPVVVCTVYSNNFMDFTASQALWEIRSGVSQGDGGTLIANGLGAVTQTANGFDNFGFTGYTVEVSGLNVALNPGKYWLTIAPIGSGFGRSFVQTTSGANAIGSPQGVNANAFFDSDYFGYDWFPTVSVLGPNVHDFSMGVRAVPEPSSIVLLGMGCGALALCVRRRTGQS